jgi:hypothetical protein
MRPTSSSVNEPAIPVTDSVLSRLLRADGSGVRALALELPARMRVELAIFCYGRNHLREKVEHVAATCDARDLIAAGEVGARLACMPATIADTRRGLRPCSKVTLATMAVMSA